MRGQGDVEGLPPRDGKPKRPKVKWKRCRECRGTGEFRKTLCAVCDGIGSLPIVPGEERPKTDWAKKMAAKHRGARYGGKYRISADGTDALLFFGANRDKNLSDIAKSNLGYLDWMLKQGDFDNDLLDVVRYQIVQARKRGPNKRWLEFKAAELGMSVENARKANRDELEDYIMKNWKEEE